MSGRAATQPPNCRTPWIAKFFLALGLLAGTGLIGAAEPVPPVPQDPAGEPKRSVALQQLQIPNKDRAIFQGRKDAKGILIPDTGIVDYTPLNLEKDNADEYQAWHEVMQHAAQFTTTELEDHADRELIWKDLEKMPSRSRLDLVRFDGQLIKVRRVPAIKSLQETGTAEVYEALIVPLDEPPTRTILAVFTELPESLASVKQTPERQWMAADARVTAAGYFFKLKRDVPNETTPVLVGKSVTVLKNPPAASPANNPAALDKNLRVFKYVRDDAPIAKEEENWEEAAAWNRILIHARRFSPEELEQYARNDLTFYDLFKEPRRDYQFDLVRFEGRLLRLQKMEPSKSLRAVGVETAYEGWLVPKDEPRGNPICVVFTDLPEGIEPNGRVNKWVSFAGYSFKLMWYESGERDAADPDKNKWRKAPLLLGRAIITRPDPDTPSNMTWRGFVTIATGTVAALVGTAVGLSLWYRRGDRKAKQAFNAHRNKNPFDATTNPTNQTNSTN